MLSETKVKTNTGFALGNGNEDTATGEIEEIFEHGAFSV
jgi:hypothetical protein